MAALIYTIEQPPTCRKHPAGPAREDAIGPAMQAWVYCRATSLRATATPTALIRPDVVPEKFGKSFRESRWRGIQGATPPTIPPPTLIAKAVTARRRITTAPQELLDLWDESDDAGVWRDAVLELEGRVTAL